MAQSTNNHFLSFVLSSCQKNQSKVALMPFDKVANSWTTITYGQYYATLQNAARHWRKVLRDDCGLSERSVVGVWLTGQSYLDSISAFAVSLAGYVPQMFSPLHAPVTLIEALMKSSGATVLLYDPSFRQLIDDAVHTGVLGNFKSYQIPKHSDAVCDGLEPITPASVAENDTAFVFHSSGTTSRNGTPKIVPNTHSWVRQTATIKNRAAFSPPGFDLPSPQIVNNVGSWAHVATVMGFLTTFDAGWTYAQTISFSPEDMLRIIAECKVNCLFVYAGAISDLIHLAQRDSTVEKTLRRLHVIAHTGWSLPEEDEDWAHSHDIPILSIYGLTETGPLMLSTYRPQTPRERLFSVFEGSGAKFRLLAKEDSDVAFDMPSENRLLEVIVPADALGAPHSSRISPDGIYHTEDLVEEVYPGYYRYRGRHGDFIRTGMGGGLCDAKQLEDRIRSHSAGLLEDCVVVGTYKPAPSVIVEIDNKKLADEAFKQDLKKHIMEFLEQYNPTLFPWERISDPKRVMIKGRGCLPRSKEKGNIRRLATETLFSSEIDALYA